MESVPVLLLLFNRLKDKFIVHAQDDKANALVNYTERFLDCQLDSFYSKVYSVQYGECYSTIDLIV